MSVLRKCNGNQCRWEYFVPFSRSCKRGLLLPKIRIWPAQTHPRQPTQVRGVDKRRSDIMIRHRMESVPCSVFCFSLGRRGAVPYLSWWYMHKLYWYIVGATIGRPLKPLTLGEVARRYKTYFSKICFYRSDGEGLFAQTILFANLSSRLAHASHPSLRKGLRKFFPRLRSG